MSSKKEEYGLTHTIISDDFHSYIIYRNFSKSIGLITTFTKQDDRFISGLEVPENRKHRVDDFKKAMPLSTYKINNNRISINCINDIDINTDIFDVDGTNDGVIHFDLITDEEEVDNKKIIKCEINPRLLIKYEMQKLNNITVGSKQFTTDKMKLFPIIMIKGFILCITTSDKSIIRFIINKPKNEKPYIGNCLQQHNAKMLNNIKLIWPIFDFYVKNNIINIELQKNIINIDNKYPVLVQLTKKLNSEDTEVVLLGKSIYIK